MPKQQQPPPEWVARFLEYISGERAYAENTVDAYRRDLEQFTAGLTKPFFLVSSSDVAEFIEKELAVTSPMTARRKFSALRSFYQFLFMEGVIERNPLRSMRAPKAHKQMIRPISNQEIEQQLDWFGSSTDGLRDRAMLLMFYGSGLRVSELVSLQLGDVDFEQRIARVRLGKGQRDRFAPMNPRQIDALQQYIKEARPKLVDSKSEQDSETVFLSGRGQKLTRQRVFQIVADSSEAAIGRRVSPHKYRHAFVTETTHGGAGIRVVQHMAGHRHVQTTMGYLHHDIERIKVEYLKAHPRQEPANEGANRAVSNSETGGKRSPEHHQELPGRFERSA